MHDNNPNRPNQPQPTCDIQVDQTKCKHPQCQCFAKASTEGTWLYCKGHMGLYDLYPR